ncbi:MAG: CsgG/HfaB family protein [Treponema sp.]
MKKKLFLTAALVLCALGSVFAADNAIAVPAPKTVNIDADGAWIPLFIQGVITSNFQQYSGLTVIDRQNTDMVKAEQKLGENAVYSDEDALQLGKLTHARFIITGNITKKASSYALIFNITDAETGETKAAANVPNCLASALENGEAANKISYDLMTGYGIKLSKEAAAALTKSAELMKSEVQAQTSLAKGILAERSGSNIEALTYYVQAQKNDRKLPEAAKLMQNMTSVVSTGNYGARAKNLIKLRNDWDKLITEARAYIESIQPEFELRYFSDVRDSYIDYHDNTIGFDVSAPYLRQTNGNELHEARHFAEKIQSALEKTQDHANWDLNSERRLYLKGEHERVELEFSVNLLNDKKRIISSGMVKYEVKYQRFWSYYSIKASSYNYWAWNGGVPKLDFQDINVNDADSDTYYISVTPANTAAKNVSILPAPDSSGEEYRRKLDDAEMKRREEEYIRKHHPNLEHERKQKELERQEKLRSLLADWQYITPSVAAAMNGMSHDEKCKKVESIVLKQQEKIRVLQEKGKLSDEERDELKKMKKELKNMKKALRWIKRHDFEMHGESTIWWT